MEGYVLKLLNSTKYPLWVLLLWGVTILFLSIGGQYMIAERVIEHNKVSETERRVGDKLRELNRYAVDFQVYTGSFVAGLKGGASDIEARKDALRKNILAQDATAHVLPDKISSIAHKERTDYRSNLKNIKNALEKVDGLESLDGFWEAAYDLLVTREVFLRKLEGYQYDSNS